MIRHWLVYWPRARFLSNQGLPLISVYEDPAGLEIEAWDGQQVRRYKLQEVEEARPAPVLEGLNILTTPSPFRPQEPT